jgi:glucan biosynthesis protein C
MSRSSLALNNLRAFVILLVLSFHSVLAYLGSLPPSRFVFDEPPFRWRSFPIVDSQRFWGFDLFCAWQDVFLMSLFFFISGLFVWPSLKRKGGGTFLLDRLLRLGLPFALVVAFLMPIAHYPTYVGAAADKSVAAYWRHLIALPLWPTGPSWFLFLLLIAALCAAALHKLFPGWGDALARLMASARDRPILYFVGLVTASAVAYLPLAIAFTPWEWWHHGPFPFQLSRPLHYAVYFFGGAAVGAYGLDRGPFALDGILVRRWGAWLGAAVASFVLWLAVTALTMNDQAAAPLGLQIAAGLSFVLACAASCCAILALVLRFAARDLPSLHGLKECAYGIYLIHYLFIVWLQFAMLDAPLPAVLKALIVFGGTLVLSWGIISAAIRSLPRVALVIGGERRTLPKAS